MIQSFKTSYQIFKKSKNKFVIISMTIAFLILLGLFLRQGLKTNEDLEDKILSNIFDFSAIFSGLLIAFIIGKVFQLRNENISRKERIDHISNKITNFRRICSIILNTWQVWSKEVTEPLSKHRNLSYFDFYKSRFVEPYPESLEKVSKFFSDADLKTETVSKFYLALKDIELRDDARYLGGVLILYDNYDRNVNYPSELLELWADSNCANEFWYCLIDNKDIAKKYFFLNNLSQEDKDRILNLSKKIDSKYQDRHLNEKLLSDLGEDFSQYYFYEILNLTLLTDFSYSSIRFMSNILGGVMLTGVLVPLILLSFEIKFEVKYYLTYICVILMILVLLWFILKIKRILLNELKTP